MSDLAKNLVPAYVSLGFGVDGDVAMFLSNHSAKITNGSPTEDRERPLLGADRIKEALSSRPDLADLPIVVRDDSNRASAIDLVRTREVVTIADLERALAETHDPPPAIYALGETRRRAERCDQSLDEARTIAGRIFYALNGLTSRERERVITRTIELTHESGDDSRDENLAASDQQ